jgi:hypothetical protein
MIIARGGEEREYPSLISASLVALIGSSINSGR